MSVPEKNTILLQKTEVKLLYTLSRYDNKRKVNSNRRKILKIGLEKIAKIQNISENELRKAEKLQK